MALEIKIFQNILIVPDDQKAVDPGYLTPDLYFQQGFDLARLPHPLAAVATNHQRTTLTFVDSRASLTSIVLSPDQPMAVRRSNKTPVFFTHLS